MFREANTSELDSHLGPHGRAAMWRAWERALVSKQSEIAQNETGKGHLERSLRESTTTSGTEPDTHEKEPNFYTDTDGDKPETYEDVPGTCKAEP